MSILPPTSVLKVLLLAIYAWGGLAGVSFSETEPAAVEETAPEAEAGEEMAAGEAGEKEGGTEEEPAEAPDDEEAGEESGEEEESERAAVAQPVTPDPVQVYGWRETITIAGVEAPLQAKLDTGALTSSIHAEEKELFERDGKKWVRFIVTDPRAKKPQRSRVEAPLVRIAHIKEPGRESIPREVVRLAFQLGDRKLRGEFTLNDRGNMINPVLIGRSMIKELGWVDSGRTYLATEKILR